MSVDQTWHVGRFYIDLCGTVPSKALSLGIDIEWRGIPSWGNRISVHIIWFCVTIGLEEQRP